MSLNPIGTAGGAPAVQPAVPQTATVIFGNGEALPIQVGQDFYLPCGEGLEIRFNGERYAFLRNPLTGKIIAAIYKNVSDTQILKTLEIGERSGPFQLISGTDGGTIGIKFTDWQPPPLPQDPMLPYLHRPSDPVQQGSSHEIADLFSRRPPPAAAEHPVSSKNYDIVHGVETLQQGDILPGREFNIDDPSTFYRELLTVNFGDDSKASEALKLASLIGEEGRHLGLSDVEIAVQIAEMVSKHYARAQDKLRWNEGRKTVGFFFEKGGCCRHRSALLQMALQEAGVMSRYVQGSLAGGGGHAWVEVYAASTGAFSYVIDMNMGHKGWVGEVCPTGGSSRIYSVSDHASVRALSYVIDEKQTNIVWRPKNGGRSAVGTKLYGGDPVSVFMHAGYDLLTDWWSHASASERLIAGTVGNIGINIGLGLAGFAAVRGYEHVVGREATGLETFAGYTAPAVAAAGALYGLAVRAAMAGGASFTHALASAVRPAFSSMPSGVIAGLPIGVSLAACASMLGVDANSTEGELGLIAATGVLSELAMMAEVGGVSASAVVASSGVAAGIAAALPPAIAVAGSALGGVWGGTVINHEIGQVISLVDPDCETLSDAIAEDPWLAAPVVSWAVTGGNPTLGLAVYGGHKAYDWATIDGEYESDMANIKAAPERLEEKVDGVAQYVQGHLQESFEAGLETGEALHAEAVSLASDPIGWLGNKLGFS